MKVIKDIAYANFERNKLDLYLPDSNEFDDFPVIVFFHGGGLESGDKTSDINLYKALVRKGIAVVSANYRMYPEAKYPEFIEDAALAVKWVNDNLVNYGANNKIYIVGSSAGAYLAMMLCFNKEYLSEHGMNPNDIAGYIFDSAQPTTHFNVLRERGLDSRRVIVDEAAPLYYIGVNTIESPIMILVADQDIANRLEQTYLVCATLKNFGYDEEKLIFKLMKGFNHVEYTYMTDTDSENVFVDMIYAFINDTKL